MADVLAELEPKLRRAVAHFWTLRGSQSTAQGSAGRGKSAGKDRGDRAAVTAGKHLDGFRGLVFDVLVAAGLDGATVYWRKRTELPGWYRAEKNWDLVVIVDSRVLAVVEFKSHVGSFGNNFNNRTEEALGNATDLWAAYAEGAFQPSERPWLGYFMMLEDAPKSRAPVRVKQPHYPVFEAFRGASYQGRYEELLTRLVRSRLYDSACLIMSAREPGLAGEYLEPNPELDFRKFVVSLLGRAVAVAQTQPPGPPEPPAVEVGGPGQS